MRQLPIPASAANTSFISTLADLVTIAGGLLAIGIAIWQFRLYRQLSDNQTAIETKQAEIDAVPDQQLAKAQQHGIAQSILDRMIGTAQTPLRHELELLERDRRFIKDKLLFTKK